jgi:hypothetical protein
MADVGVATSADAFHNSGILLNTLFKRPTRILWATLPI